MPHTGKPSKGCAECKKRHAKCDEQRPACGRCVRGKRQCPGYPEGLDLVLRTQNDMAKTAVQKREHLAKLKRNENLATAYSADSTITDSASSKFDASHSTQPDSNTSHSTSESSDRKSCAVIRRCASPSSMCVSLRQSDEVVALPFFVSGYVYPTGKLSGTNILQCVPQLFLRTRSDSALSLATVAVARLLFTAWEKRIRDPEQPTVKIAFGRAMTATRLALADPIERLSDETLTAVCLLGLYENVAEAFRANIASPRHYEGAMALLKHRWSQGVESEVSNKLLSSVRNQIVGQPLNLSLYSLNITETRMTDMYKNSKISKAVYHQSKIRTDDMFWEELKSTANNASTKLDVLSVEVANIVASEKDLSIPLGKSSSPCVTALVESARKCEEKLTSWPEAVPLEGLPVRMHRLSIPTEVVEAGIYNDTCDVYQNLSHSTLWNSWRSARLRILYILILYGDVEDAVYAKAVMQRMVDDMCASIPFTLGSRTTQPVSLFDGGVTFPFLGTDEELREHKVAAAAWGGWMLFVPFKDMLTVFPYLRDGQPMWIRAQFDRLRNIYDAIISHKRQLKCM